MKPSANTPFLETYSFGIQPFIKTSFLFTAGILTLIIASHLPLSAQTSAIFRHGFSIWLIGALIILVFVLKIRNLAGDLISFCFIILLFTLPLTALWRQGYGEMQIIGGLLSFSDSARYYYEANRLLEGFPLTSFGARHPITPVLLSAILRITGENLQWTLSISVLLIAITVYWGARLLQRTHNTWVSSFFVILLFIYYRRFIGMTDTENVGVLFGMLAFILLWQGSSQRDRTFALAGLFFASLALNARPGAFFTLLTLLIWYCASYLPKHKWISQINFWIAIGMVLLPFLMNMALVKGVSAGNKGLFANYAYTLYGITDGGTGWEKVFQDYPELQKLPEEQTAVITYGLAINNLRNKPMETLKGIGSSYLDFFSLKDQSAFGFVSGGDLTAFNKPETINIQIYRVTRMIMWFLSLLGIIWLWRGKSNLFHSLILWVGLGIFLSIPFLPPRDAAIMRVYAGSLPFIIIFPAMGLNWLMKSNKNNQRRQDYSNTIPFFVLNLGGFLCIAMVVGSIALHLDHQPVAAGVDDCPTGKTSMIVKVREGSYLFLVPDENLNATQLPLIRQSDFINSLGQFPYAEEIVELSTLDPPILIMNAIDLHSGQMLWAILPPVEESSFGGPLRICGEWLPGLKSNGLGFLYTKELKILE